MKKRRGFPLGLLFHLKLLLVVSGLLCGCSLNQPPKTKVPADLDFDKVSLILTEAEQEVYRRLSPAERPEFLDLCWKFRDPDPATEENELREEFKERVAYANRWFSPIAGDRLSQRPDAQIRDAGWFTERGKVYLVLGPPDRMFFLLTDGDFRLLEHDQLNERWRYDSAGEETWEYDRYKMVAHFYRENGRWYADYSPELLDTMAEVKRDYLNAALSPKLRFHFDVKFEDGQLALKIPANRVNFVEENNLLLARFKVEVVPYRGVHKLEEQLFNWEIKLSPNEKREKRSLTWKIPVNLSEQGAYLLEVVLEDVTGGEVAGRGRTLGSAVVKTR